MRLILLILLLYASAICAQPDLRFHHYRTADGLSSPVVRCMLQDSRGFIWIGTDYGLNRFDGIEFKTFISDPDNPKSISGNQIKAIAEDSQGDLWIATYDGGLNRYIRRQDSFEHFAFELKGLNSDLFKKSIALTLCADDEVWVGFEMAPLIHFKPGSEPVFHEKDTVNFGRDRSYVLHASRDNRVYLGQLAYGLTYSDGKDFKRINSTMEFPYPGAVPTCIHEDDSGLIWHGGWDNCLMVYDPATDDLRLEYVLDNGEISFSGEEIQALEQFGPYLWIGSRYTGLRTYDPNTRKMFHYRHEPFNPQSIASNAIHCILKDSEGRMWIGSDNGISVYDPLRHQFEVVYMSGSVVSSRSEEVVNCFYEGHDGLYVGTTNGLWQFLPEQDEWRYTAVMYEGQELQVHSMLELQAGEWLLGTNRSLYRWSPGLRLQPMNTMHLAFNRGGNDFFNLLSSRVSDIMLFNYQGKEIIFAPAFGYGLGVFSPESWSGFMHNPVHKENSEWNMESEPLVRKLVQDSKGRLWLIGASSGLHCGFKILDQERFEICTTTIPGHANMLSYDPEHAIVTYHTEFDTLLPPLTNAYDLVELQDGDLLCTTYGSGLWRIDPTEFRAERIIAPNPNLEGMAQDREGNVWILSSGGFEVFDEVLKRWFRYDQSDGIPPSGVSGYLFEDHQGIFYAGGNGFFLKFDPTKVQRNTKLPQPTLTGFSILAAKADHLLENEVIYLDHTQNNLTFSFSAMQFTNPDRNKYAYRLLGFEDDWIECGNVNFARYHRLEGGKYEFQVKASNSHGLWSDNYASILVHISPPFWQTLWFRSLVVLAIILVSILFYLYRMQQLKRSQLLSLSTEISAQEKERNRLANDLHDDLGVKMSTLKLYLNSIENRAGKNEDLKMASAEAQSLLDSSISELRNLLNNLSPKNVTRHGIYKAINETARRISQLTGMKIEYTYSFQNERFEPEAELSIYRVVQELIQNSIKHSGGDLIRLHISESSSGRLIEYSDNGKGYPVTARDGGKGIKLHSIENRLSITGGKLEWHADPNFAFSVTISFPKKP